MADPKNHLFEWKIENFSCWCEAVHGKCIKSPQFFLTDFLNVELYPRGISGQDDRMEVRFCDVKKDFICDLTYIDFKGSENSSKQVKVTSESGGVLGPYFDEVVAKITKNDMDGITMRFCIQDSRNYVQIMCTRLNVWKVSLKIDPKLLSVLKINDSNEKYIFYLTPYWMIEDGMGILITQQKDRVLLIMKPLQWQNNTILVKSYMNMVNSEGFIVKHEENRHVFINREPWTFSESLKRQEWDEKGNIIYLRLKMVENSIVQSCNNISYIKEVSVETGNSITFHEKSPADLISSNQLAGSMTELSKELMCVYQDQDFSDITLKCNNVTFPVHKVILSARSPVLKAMLSTDMRETASGQVDIIDLDPSTLALFLTFLYTGTVGEEGLKEESALNLYYAADKYQVPTLKRECVDFLRANVSNSNVCDILSLADKHKDDELIAVSHHFILENYSDVLGSKEWAEFMEREPLLAVKTVTLFAQKKYVRKVNIP